MLLKTAADRSRSEPRPASTEAPEHRPGRQFSGRRIAPDRPPRTGGRRTAARLIAEICDQLELIASAERPNSGQDAAAPVCPRVVFTQVLQMRRNMFSAQVQQVSYEREALPVR